MDVDGNCEIIGLEIQRDGFVHIRFTMLEDDFRQVADAHLDGFAAFEHAVDCLGRPLLLAIEDAGKEE